MSTFSEIASTTLADNKKPFEKSKAFRFVFESVVRAPAKRTAAICPQTLHNFQLLLAKIWI